MQFETIKEINSLNPIELDEFIKGLKTDEEKIEVLRVLMPLKLISIFKNKRYKFMHSGRGPGKSVSVAKALLKKGDNKRLRILCAREVQNSIKDSVHSTLKDLIIELNYKDYIVTEKTIYNKRTKTEFIFRGLLHEDTKQNIKSFSNIDIVWIEEAQSVSSGSLKILDPTIRKKGSEIWFTFNRLLPNDPVWEFQESIEGEEKIVIYMTYEDNLFLPEILLKQALRSKKRYEEKIDEDYPHIWLGEPASFGERTVLKYRDIIKAVERKIKEPTGGICVGADIARFGKDRTVFFKRKGFKIIDWKVYSKTSIDECVGYLIEFVGRTNTDIKIKIDDTGLGGGVTDYMMKYGYNVVPISFGGTAQEKDKYFNAISEMWFNFKDIIGEVDLPNIQELKNELATREYGFDNQERRRIQSKDEFKKKYGKSPDYADACLLCFYNVDNIDGYFFDGVI